MTVHQQDYTANEYTMPSKDPFEPIAVVGFALKFPQDVTSSEAFWKLLMDRRSTKTEVPKDRWNTKAFFKPDGNKSGTMKSEGGHFLADDLGAFDAPFFSISPAEAECMDPQQRMLLETSYHALENAGIPLEKATGSNTSVHVGCFLEDYGLFTGRDPEMPAKYSVTGSGALTIIANRVSWFYDFRGPSMTVDTACSSSMVAMHLACQELQAGNVSMGLACGANLFFNPDSSARLSDLNFLSPDGVCYSFDERANGYSRGEGFGVVVLKRLDQAIADGDTIRTVIRSTACNQDGKTPGITQPSKAAQEKIIQETYRRAGLDLLATRYFEAHGTGTPVGDPLEASAISNTFACRTESDPIYVGAVKSNIGHLEGASGLAGVIKTILALEAGIIPPNVYPEQVNPSIAAACSNIAFPHIPLPWPTDGLRRASINSFGFGGTNAHIILDDARHYLHARNLRARHLTKSKPLSRYQENRYAQVNGNGEHHIQDFKSFITNGYEDAVCNEEYQNGFVDKDRRQHHPNKSEESQPSSANFLNLDESSSLEEIDTLSASNVLGVKLLTLSAFDEAGIARNMGALNQHLVRAVGEQEGVSLNDLAYTLCMKRSRFTWATTAVASEDNMSELEWSAPIRSQKDPRICFLFTGQGAQWYNMGYELMQFEVFRQSIEAADRHFTSLGSSWSMLDELYIKPKEFSKINEPECSQPICTAIQVAIVDLLESWGVYPSVVIGHSSGEIAAAYSSGAICRTSAWMIAYYRGLAVVSVRDLQKLPGAMMSVQAAPEHLRPYVDHHNAAHTKDSLVMACYNSPSNITVSGSHASVARLAIELTDNSIAFRILNVDVAYHSHHMKPVGIMYERLLRNITPRTGYSRSCHFMSSVTGKLLSSNDTLLTSEYWTANLTNTVQFCDAMKIICSASKKNADTFNESLSTNLVVEIGPHSALRSPVKDIFHSLGRSFEASYTSILTRNRPASVTAVESAGRLYCLGYPIDLCAVNRMEDLKPNLLVTLPYYSFSHQIYWLEGRNSRGFRFRKYPHHELLGTRVSDWNALEARWINRIILSEKPFLEDHKVNGMVLYPAAGMAVMAIEAMRQLCEGMGHIQGYKLRDVAFSKAINLTHDPHGTEVQLTLRPTQQKTSKTKSSWNEFCIYTYEQDTWSECCSGAVSMELEELYHPFQVNEDEEILRQNMGILRNGWSECTSGIDLAQAYETFQKSGIEFGPAFKGMRDLKWNQDTKTTATVPLYHWKSNTSRAFCEPHLVHPATLDAVFQLMLPALSNGGVEPFPTGVPTRLRRAWISASLLDAPAETELLAYSDLRKESFRTFGASIVAASSITKEPCLIGEIEMSTIADVAPDPERKEKDTSRRLFNITCKPDFDFLPAHAVLHKPPNDGQEPLVQEKEALCAASILTSLEKVPDDVSHMPIHLQRYVQWMKAKTTAQTGYFRPIETLCHQLDGHDAEGKLLVRVAKNLDQILSGELDALNLLFADDIMTQYYLDFSTTPLLLSETAKHVNILSHKYPNMRIIEIGAGTGCMTGPVLDALDTRVSEYIFTDISPSFFNKAKERFQHPRMSFKTLDISRDPVDQGFEEGAFDVVIAANVLHATENLGTASSYCRKLLKSGGRMILFENINRQMLRGGFIFGLLPGWWCSNDAEKNLSPLLTDSEWDLTLKKAGFSGIDVRINDAGFETQDTVLQIMFATAADPVTQSDAMVSVKIGGIPDSPMQTLLLNLAPERCAFEPICWDDLQRTLLPDSVCVILPELSKGLLGNLDEKNLCRLRHIVESSRCLIWVSFQGPELTDNPEHGLATGLARTAHSERDDFQFVTLTLEKAWSIESAVKSIAAIIEKHSTPKPATETEYLQKDGIISIPRIVEAATLKKKIFPDANAISTVEKPWNNAEDVQLTIANVGLLDTLYFVECPLKEGQLGDDEIDIEIKAAGLNFRDVLCALGQVNGDYFGSECAGIIKRVGPSSTHDLHVGDRVVALSKDTIGRSCRCHYHQVYRIPQSMEFIKAASYVVAYCTAYYSLVHWARVRKGESVLIHSGAGGFGQAAIQLCQHFGCELFVTVGSVEKAAFLRETYGIPIEHIFSSRDLEFAKGIKRLTNGRGVDVVLNSLAGDALRESWSCVAQFGRFIEVGKKDIYAPPVSSMGGLPMFPFSKNVMFASVDLPQVATTVGFKDILEGVMRLAEEGIISPPKPLHVFGQHEVEKAFRFMQTGNHTGKIIIEFVEDQVVQIQPAPRQGPLFGPGATYLIAGAFGGIGQSIAKWMVVNGARNLILPSRSPVLGTGNPRERFVQELQTDGVRVEAPICDIADEAQLQQVLRDLDDMPPIKGCIQSAMVLKDSTFKTMPLENWRAALAPKFQGTWNLHELLPYNLDFFIMLSSQAGLAGSFGQSNYAAGNTYQDALAAHRIRHGQKAISIDLGTIASVGYVAENAHVQAMMRSRGILEDFKEQDVLALLQHYCDPNLLFKVEDEAQIITTLPLPTELRARGMVEPPHLSRSLLSHLNTITTSHGTSSPDSADNIKHPSILLQEANTLDEASDIISEAVCTQLSNLLVVDKENIDASKPIYKYGVDSLVAVELRNWFSKGLGADVPVIEILGNDAIQVLSRAVARKSKFVGEQMRK